MTGPEELKPQDSHAEERAAIGPEAGPELVDALREHILLEQQFQAGARALASIGSFSLIHTGLLYSGATIPFVGVLGTTRLLDGMALGLAKVLESNLFLLAGAALVLLAAGFFYWLAARAGEGRAWAFRIGMAVYALDGVVALVVGDHLEVACHLVFLAVIRRGLLALCELEERAVGGA